MAIFSQSAQVISRGKGRSAVAAAAYRAGERIQNQYDGMMHDYREIQNRVVHSEILLPEHAPREYADRSTLWNEVERVEKAKNAQLSREVRIALPIEISREDNIELVREYVQEQYVDNGMISDINVHDSGDENPHVHIMLTMRSIDKSGYWMDKKRKIYILDGHGNKQYDPAKKTYKCRTEKTNNWDSKAFLAESRAAWSDKVNGALKERGIDVSIDHRSYRDKGLDKLPGVHMGAKCTAMERRGEVTARGEYNRAISAYNEAKENDLHVGHTTRLAKPECEYTVGMQERSMNSIERNMAQLENPNLEGIIDREQVTKEIAQEKTFLIESREGIFFEYGRTKTQLENTAADDPNRFEHMRQMDAAEKFAFPELRNAMNEYTQAEKELGRAKYDLMFAQGNPEEKGRCAERVEACQRNVAEKRETLRIKKAVFLVQEKTPERSAQIETPRAEVPREQTPKAEAREMSVGEMEAALKKRDWSIDEIKQIPKELVQKEINELKREYAVSMKEIDDAKWELEGVVRTREEIYSKYEPAHGYYQGYNVLSRRRDEQKVEVEAMKAQIKGAGVMDRLWGNNITWKQELASAERYLRTLEQDMVAHGNKVKEISGVDVTKDENFTKWLYETKGEIDKRYNLIEAEKEKNLEAKIAAKDEKRLEAIEKVALAKDQRKLDEEGHSMREAMLEQGESKRYAVDLSDTLKKPSKDEVEKIIERKERMEQPRERDAIAKTLQAERALMRGIEKGLEIGEDVFR